MQRGSPAPLHLPAAERLPRFHIHLANPQVQTTAQRTASLSGHSSSDTAYKASSQPSPPNPLSTHPADPPLASPQAQSPRSSHLSQADLYCPAANPADEFLQYS